MENKQKKELLGKLADVTPLKVYDIQWIFSQSKEMWVGLSGEHYSDLNIRFEIENEMQAAKYNTLISFFNSEAHKEKGHYLELYGDSYAGDQTADKFMFWYTYE